MKNVLMKLKTKVLELHMEGDANSICKVLLVGGSIYIIGRIAINRLSLMED